MSLPISDIVQVDIAVSPTLAPLAGFGEMLFLTDELKALEVVSPAERVRLFGSLKEVQEALPEAVECVAAATAYFSQTPQPRQFSVGVQGATAFAGSLTSGTPASLEEIKATGASAGFEITIDGTKKIVSADVSSCVDLVDVAKKVEDSITTAIATCKYVGGRFVIVSKTTGLASKVEFPVAKAKGTSLEVLMGLTPAKGAVKEAGSAGEKVDEALAKCLDARSSFVAVVTTRSMRDGDKVEVVAAWCEASKKLFLNTTNDLKVMDATLAKDTVAYALKNKAFSKTITTLGINEVEYPSCSLFGRIATVNYEGTNTAITLKFKKLPGITALDLRASQKAAMDSVNVGGFQNYAGNLMYAESRMADNGWLDAAHGLLWLENRIQVGVFNLMYVSTNKIPATDTGVNMVVQRVVSALQQGVTNGLLAPGNNTAGEFLPNGYRVTARSITEGAPEDKSNRIYRGITFDCVGAGALHNVVISGSFNE